MTNPLFRQKIGLLITSLLGTLFSIYATILSVEIRENIKMESLCSINTLFDCKYIAASEAALLFGIPLGWWAFIYYLWIGSVAIWMFFSPANRKSVTVPALIVSTFALAFTIFKACQMIFELKAICLVCILLYCANVTIVILLVRISGVRLKKILAKSAITYQEAGKSSWQNLICMYLPWVISLIIVFGIGYFVFKFSVQHEDSKRFEVALPGNDSISNNDLANNAVANHLIQTRRIIELTADIPLWGNPKSKVTVVEFSDFQCPYCQVAASRLRQVLSEFKNDVKLYFIHYPLDKSINPYITTSTHPYAGLAARAAIYAYDRGKFWEFHDDLFQRQADLNDEIIYQLARNYGWNIDQFKNAIGSNDIIKRVRKQIKSGQNIGIRGTPAIYINGRYFEQWQNQFILRKIIQHEIRNSI